MRQGTGLARLAAGLALSVLALSPLRAHQASDAYLRAAIADDGTVALRVDVALRDLDLLLELDQDADGRLRWGEVRQRDAEIAARVQAGLAIEPERCALRPTDAQALTLDRKADGTYVRLHYASNCRAADAPRLAYTLLSGIDPTHRGLLQRIGSDGQPAAPLLSLAPGGAAVSLWPGGTAAPGASPPAGFFADGLHHILIGADHVLFLVCLLLPVVLGRGGEQRSGRSLAWSLVGLVSAFTVGHSITLGLAAWRLLSVPPSVIEPLIAATIALAAFDNLRPWLGKRRALAALAFGLIHGFGFAGPLLEIELPPVGMAWALLQFNLGVEAGQLLVVMLALALLWPLRRHGLWARRTLAGGSLAAGVMALVWFGERVLDTRLLAL